MKENFGHKKFFVINKNYYEKILVTKKLSKIFCHKNIFVIKNFCNEKKIFVMKKNFCQNFLS